ncbi:hypothetical protein BOX15_Mlig007871g2 [Macrostomum lignano]|uniref:Uncharacterized protein n=2 Tax=Macrostomum lignano TaxID=282301 RepID=A0A267GIB1_9PLAT|nr:hypothetical protein BOX15_Mlig007871g1 [Macrostomum lignano]PAA84942.1 hypothetical protein BOX15_Mlig007871g2 [Macrostomum lignano]
MAKSAPASAGRVALVTGGSAGIGRGCVEALVGDGAFVAFCSNQAEEGRQLEAALNAAGPGRALFIEVDCRNATDLEAAVNQTLSFGSNRLDWLINNVGTHPDHAPIDHFSLDDLRSLMELNVYSAFSLTRLCLPHIRASKGAIVNISSLVAVIGQHHAVTYVITKSAISGFTRALAIDEAVHGVRVNAICPGAVHTPLLLSNANSLAAEGGGGDTTEDQLARYASDSLFNRLGSIEEIGAACLFLCRWATYCTGIELPVTAGVELAKPMKTN